MSALDELCANAVQRQLEGQLDEAERLYRDVLLIDGRHAAANHCFGMLNVQFASSPEAMPYLLAALEASPQLPDYWLGYLEALLLAGRLEDAVPRWHSPSSMDWRAPPSRSSQPGCRPRHRRTRHSRTRRRRSRRHSRTCHTRTRHRRRHPSGAPRPRAR